VGFLASFGYLRQWPASAWKSTRSDTLKFGRRCWRRCTKRDGTITLFLRPDGLLVGYLETPDFVRACAQMKEHPVNAKWQAEMSPFFEAIGDSGADDNMIPLEEVFHLD
jgi:L-rhamnose mutarotase